MKCFPLPVLMVGLVAMLHAPASAQSASGNWKGHAEMKPPPISSSITGEKRAKIEEMIRQYQSMVLVLNLNTNRTFTWHMFGGPKFVDSRLLKGSWKQEGEKITLTFPKTPRAAEYSMSGTVGNNGSTLDVLSASGAHFVCGRG